MIENNISNIIKASGDDSSITLTNNVLAETSASGDQIAYNDVFTNTLGRYSVDPDDFKVNSNLTAGADINALKDTDTTDDTTDDTSDNSGGGDNQPDNQDQDVEVTVSGDTTGSVVEDGSLTTSGDLDIDGGSGNNEFLAENLTGKHGDFSVDTEGNWSYTAVDSSQIQALDSGEKLTETFVVKTAGGVETEVEVFIKGQDEPQSNDNTDDPDGNQSDGNVIEVSSAAELMVAMNNASGGDVITLLSGDYGSVSLRNFNFDTPVTIISADSGNPAHLENLYVNNSSNITIEQLAIYSDDDPVGSWGEHLTSVQRSSDIVLKNNQFGNEGQALADNFYGLSVSNSTGIDVIGNEFSNLGIGTHVRNSQDLNVSDNNVHDIGSKGFSFSTVQGVEIAGNTITDMYSTGGSLNSIQFFGYSGKQANSDIVIRDNLILQGDGEDAQGIFLNSQSGSTYENVLIENNVVYQSGYHGISVYHADGLEIKDNTVISPPDTEHPVWIGGFDVKNAVIENNISNVIKANGDDSSITLTNNVLAETSASGDQLAYKDVFTNTLDRNSVDPSDFEVNSSLSAGADINALTEKDTDTSDASTNTEEGFGIFTAEEGSDIIEFTDKNDNSQVASKQVAKSDIDANSDDKFSFDVIVSEPAGTIGDEEFIAEASGAQAGVEENTKVFRVDIDGDQAVDIQPELIGISLYELENSDFLT